MPHFSFKHHTMGSCNCDDLPIFQHTCCIRCSNNAGDPHLSRKNSSMACNPSFISYNGCSSFHRRNHVRISHRDNKDISLKHPVKLIEIMDHFDRPGGCSA